MAAIGIGAWLAHGLFGSYRAISRQRPGPLAVLTSDALGVHPSRTFLLAAGAAVVLALAIQAPAVALVPVLALLFLYGVAWGLERSERLGSAERRAWAVYGLTALGLGLGLWAFLGPEPLTAGVWGAAAGGGALLAGPTGTGLRSLPPKNRVRRATRSRAGGVVRYRLDRRSRWPGGPGVLNFQSIPPFVRFALVFLLFLLAVRAGLVCRRVLDEEEGRSVTALGLLVIPVGVLLVFMLFDFGLGLVFFLPMMLTVLLAVGVNRMGRTLTVGSLVLLAAVVFGLGPCFVPAWRV